MVVCISDLYYDNIHIVCGMKFNIVNTFSGYIHILNNNDVYEVTELEFQKHFVNLSEYRNNKIKEIGL